MSFLPDGYEVPKSEGSNYMNKWKAGANKFRILSAPVLGWEYWTEDDKPVRAKERWPVIPVNAKLPWSPKHFWAMVVWNFDIKAIQILEITQVTILTALQALIQEPEWGDPREYSITVTRAGEKLTTTYSVVPSPAKPTPKEILHAYKENPINLEALFDGNNPFEKETKETTAREIYNTAADDVEKQEW